jgi:glycosyltransferase involved in cell wall biosynthesis
MRHQLQDAGPLPLEVIENGFDPADFEHPARISHSAEAFADFILAHVGSLNEARNPHALWSALAALRPDDTMPRFRISLIGNVEPAVLMDAERHGLRHRIDVLPYLPHSEAVRRMQRSTMLLLSINRVKGAEGIVTGKLYEYMASGRPVIGIGPVDGDAARVLQVSDAGRMFDFGDASGIADHLRACYDGWAEGSPLHGATRAAADRYSRLEQAGRLARILDQLVT